MAILHLGRSPDKQRVDQDLASIKGLQEPFGTAFNDPGARFGIRALGTVDVYFQSRPSPDYPRTCCLLASAPGHEAVRQVVDRLMAAEAEGYRLWRFAKIEARVCVPLDFGTS